MESLTLFRDDRNQQLGLLGLLLLLIGKSVTTQGYVGWVNNRLRTFRGILGIPEDQFIWTIGVVPLQPVLASLSTFLSANQPLRTRLYHVCVRASESQISMVTQIFITVLKLLRGVEMNHILLIDYYLFNKYPEILRVRAIRDNMAKYNQALEYLAGIADYERLYVKLIKKKTETDILNRNNFIMLSAAAFAAARYEIPSMKNYQGGQQQAAGGHIDKVVHTYLTMRTQLSLSSIVRAPSAYMSQEEQALMIAESERKSRGIPVQIGIAADPEPASGLPRMQLRTQQT